ncbi:MAG: type II CRISPR RNA-guided endonuclease Cas9 [Erysipelotrichaceae bacterium]
MTKSEKIYSIGLDIGTTSVGWSLVDDNYSILKHQGRNLWGVRLFEEGTTAAERRLSRGTRRRIQRRKQRISLLKMLVGDMVINVDPNFFMRLEKGYATLLDKGYDYNLFIEESFNDKDYNQKFNTIYHLRKYLSEASEKADPRLIYLALHHIVKYRGNFLYEGQSFEVSDTKQVSDNLFEVLNAIITDNEFEIEMNDKFVSDMLNILLNGSLKKANKKDLLIKQFTDADKETKKVMTELVNLLLGYESNISKLFPLINIQKEEKDCKTNFNSTKYDDDIDFFETNLQDSFETLQLLHNVYSYITLQDMLKGQTMICDAMINKYEKHKKDLKELKTFVKKYYTLEDYQLIFRKEGIVGNYYSYINEPKSTSKIELYAFIKKVLDTNTEAMLTDEYQTITNDIEMDNYLPKQNSKDNGTIPYQMHEIELIKILENQGKFYPQLKENKDKIIKTFRFRIPYYVGPLNKNSEFSWIERSGTEKITPWNFDQQVNSIASAENFIRRMTNNCTYLLGEEVIPKKSLLYTKFEVLNELNKIRINDKLIEYKTKMEIINDIFLVKKKIKEKDIREFLIVKQYYHQDDNIEIKGFQKENEFSTSLEPWIDFKKIYGDEFDTHKEEIERIIEWISVYEDKKILKKRIELEYPHLDQNKISMIMKKRYSGWGRLSKKLLDGIKGKDDHGDIVTIIECMEHTNLNFMQIINDKKLGFNKEIEKESFKDKQDEKVSYEEVKELQGSPAINKGVWQTIKIIEELIKVMKSKPQNIFIEFARSDDEKKRTESQVKRLQDIYAQMKKDLYMDEGLTNAYKSIISKDKKTKLNDDRLYLYYIQQGKCMYSGKALDLDKLSTYQIDHIVPQSYIKDDSFENRVLVLPGENQYKGDNLLLSQKTINSRIGWWKQLKDYKLIGSKKFYNLTKATITTQEEMGFINRQLVETRQITKHVANLLKNHYEDVNIVSIKANLSHDFRDKYKLFKVREINDYHHAQDAYLSCIIGTYVMRAYPTLQKEFIFTEYNQLSNFRKEINQMQKSKGKYGFIINQMSNTVKINEETGEPIWEGEKTIQKIISTFSYKDCYITKKVEERKGQLFDLTIVKRDEVLRVKEGKLHEVVPINKQREDISQYGGFTKLKYAYGIAVEYPKKKKLVRTVLNVPRHIASRTEDDLLAYLKAETGSEEVKIVKDKILFNQLMEIDGAFVTMASASEWNNAQQLLLTKKAYNTIYNLFNNKTWEYTDEDVIEVYDEYLEKLSKYYLIYQTIYKQLSVMKEQFILSVNKKKIFTELLKLTKSNAMNGSLKDEDFNLSARFGRISMKTIDLNKTIFIDQSITGIYTKKYKL